ncbi:cell filamentation protein Fic [Candidatus Pacearchaeota archaeon CG_4_9_14_3_um_filter_35_19]|nr:MAG: cell filamentation protein Fic [Candidatus Pacearchaeota archaeon CG_4_9_14_3_um_filter_35_19]
METSEFKGAFGKLVKKETEEHGEYLSFIPEKLPPNFDYTPQLVLSLSKADSTLSKLSGAGLLLPNPDLLVIPYLKKEALSSSRIEGTRISLSDYFLTEAKGIEKEDIEATEVGNYLKSMNYALKKIEKEPINTELIKEMHKLLMKGVRGNELLPGNFRPVQNWIGPKNTKIQDVTFVPPPQEEVEKLVNGLIEYLNKYDEVPLLIKCALMHYQFETIHPFCDGNGRIGRSLITLYLCKKNKISKPLLYASDYFEKHRREYYETLLNANKTGKFEEWIKFFLEAIKVQSEDALERTIKIQKLSEKYQEKTKNHKQAINLLSLVDLLFMNPFIRINQVAKKLNITYPTAKKAVQNLIKLNILKPTSEKERNKLFVAHEILDVVIV